VSKDFAELWSESRIKSLMLAEFGGKGEPSENIESFIIDAGAEGPWIWR
jgi:hypothetical protein